MIALRHVPTVKDVLIEYKKAKFKPGAQIQFSDNLYVRVEEHKHGFHVFVLDVSSDKPVGMVKFINPLKDASPSAKSGLRTLGRLFKGKIFTPHATIAKTHQNQGIVSAIYRWFLDAGNSLVSWDAQTRGGNILWRSLARSYPVFMLDMDWNGKVKIMGKPRNNWDTRMLMLGKGVKLPHELEES